METIEEYKTIRIINEEPDFFEVEQNNFQVDYFILCEEGNQLFGKNIFELQICGMSLVNWVVRVCGRQPKILKVKHEVDALDVIKPYIDCETEYSVVFYADTPLLNKNHVNDLLGYIDRRQMNVCKFKRGFAFRNNYIKENDEIYSIDEYDFASDDFFVVESSEDFEYARKILTKKVVDYHKNNNVYFENENNVCIDANIEIGEFSKIADGVSVVDGSKIGCGTYIQKNSFIKGSTIGDNTLIGVNVIVDKSIIKNGVIIAEKCLVKNSVIGNNVRIDFCSIINSSSVREGAVLKNNVCVEESRIGENSVIQKHCKILGLTDKTVIGRGCDIGANSEIMDSAISSESIVDDCSKIKDKVGM